MAPPDGVRFGSTAGGNGFGGAIDEVRISRVARTTFHPALGEDDDAYRARLRIFRRWVLPTPANLVAMINEAAPLKRSGAVRHRGDQPDRRSRCSLRYASCRRRWPRARQSHSTAPPPRTRPSRARPTMPASIRRSISWPIRTQRSMPLPIRGRAACRSGLPAHSTRWSRRRPGKFILEHSFDPLGPTPLHAVGRAIRLRHQTLAAGALGALAHRAGFTYVRNLGPDLAVAVAKGERLAIRSSPAVAQRVDVGVALDLTIAPAIPAAGTFAWTIVTPGPARAHFWPIRPIRRASGRRLHHVHASAYQPTRRAISQFA